MKQRIEMAIEFSARIAFIVETLPVQAQQVFVCLRDEAFRRNNRVFVGKNFQMNPRRQAGGYRAKPTSGICTGFPVFAPEKKHALRF